MKILYLLVILLSTNFIFSQNVIVEYNSIENTNDAVLATNSKYTLIVKDYESIYFNIADSLKQFKYDKFIMNSKKIGELIQVQFSDNQFGFLKQDLLYKGYEKDTMIFNEILLNKKVIVGENIQLFNWEIVPKTDTLILKYRCQKAISKFRGRNYEAYFSSELANGGGPWKFHGLPGLILYVRSLDNYYVIKPTKIISNSKISNEIFNVYKNEKIISWKVFKSLFKKKLEEQLKVLQSKSEDGEGGSIKITDKVEDLEISEMKF